jgi:hypothetical protein
MEGRHCALIQDITNTDKNKKKRKNSVMKVSAPANI